MLLASSQFLELLVEFRRDDVGFVFQKILPNELHEAKVRVLLEESPREGVRLFGFRRVAAVENQMHVLRLNVFWILAEREEVFTEMLVLDDFVDVQRQVDVVLRKRVVQVRRNRRLVRKELLPQLVRVQMEQVRFLKRILHG